jgi:protein phosphatase 1 regulatory subunit 7
MNQISAVQGGFEECPNLRKLTMTDNLLTEIPPYMFTKCKQLTALNLEINRLRKISNLHALANLQDLNLHNNRIEVMEGLTSLTKLRRLNLSFNQIQKVEGISSLL